MALGKEEGCFLVQLSHASSSASVLMHQEINPHCMDHWMETEGEEIIVGFQAFIQLQDPL